MPKILRARPAVDAAEEKTVRKLAEARHAPGDWIQRARMVVPSWSGARVPAIAVELGCHEQTVEVAGVGGPLDGFVREVFASLPRKDQRDKRVHCSCKVCCWRGGASRCRR